MRALQMKNRITAHSAKVKKKESPQEEDEAPEVTPFSLFKATENLMPIKPYYAIEPPQYVIPRRTLKKNIEAPQYNLPIPKQKPCQSEPCHESFPIRSFSCEKGIKVQKAVPNFSEIDPIQSKALVSSDGIRHIIMYKPPLLHKILSQSFSNFYAPSQISSFSSEIESTRVSLKQRASLTEFDHLADSLFRSPIEPPTCTSAESVLVNHPLLKTQQCEQIPVPCLPPVSHAHVFDSGISAFEYKKLKPRKRQENFVVRYIPTEADFSGRYIDSTEELQLNMGEFIVVECSDNNPIIQPLVGMASRLDVIIDDPSVEDHHPFDKRIPLTHVSPNRLQPFIAPIPHSKYVLAMTSSVSVCAIAPHPSRQTDFIISLGRKPTIHPFPKLTYLSTSPESTVTIPRPNQRAVSTLLSEFISDDLPSPEVLCCYRSMIKGLQFLDSKEIIFRNMVPHLSRVAQERMSQLSPSNRQIIKDYIDILKSTPWYRSFAIARARLGTLRGYRDVTGDDGHLNLSEVRGRLAETFENNLHYIGGTENEKSNENFDLTLFGGEEEDWEDILDKIDEKPHDEAQIPIAAMKKTNIDWDALGFADVRRRKVLKRIEFSIVSGNLRAEVKWIRDPKLIRREQSKKMLRRSSSSEITRPPSVEPEQVD